MVGIEPVKRQVHNDSKRVTILVVSEIISETAQNLTVKLDLELAIGHERQLRAQIQLEGDADLVARASSAVTTALTALMTMPAAQTTPPATAPVAAAGAPVVAPPPTPSPTIVAMPTAPPKIAPEPKPKPTPAPVSTPAATLSAASAESQPQNGAGAALAQRALVQRALAQRDWSKFSVSFGALLVLAALAVAVIFPPLVPREQRLEVFMMSLAFGLLGTLALYAGALPGKGRAVDDGVKPASRAKADPHAIALQRAAFLRTQTMRPIGASLWGMTFGIVFVLAGVIAPFVLGTGDADERFLMMLGFAPVAAVGILLIAIFWRRMRLAVRPTPRAGFGTPTATPAAPRSTRSPVPRAPDTSAFKVGVPAALATLGLLLLLVIGLVIVATLVPMLR